MGTRAKWQPTAFLRFHSNVRSSTGVAEILTDDGLAFVKARGNAAGLHALACELVGTRLADLLGLPTFDAAVMTIGPDDEIPLGHDLVAEQGAAFLTRKEAGFAWSGDPSELELLDNPDDVSGLVLFDTWTRNCDRFCPEGSNRRPHYDNVFLSAECASPERFILKAMDHTHCFTCGGNLTTSLSGIDKIKDDNVFGLFPSFVPYLREPSVERWVARLGEISSKEIAALVDAIPNDWDVSDSARAAMKQFLSERALYLSETFPEHVGRLCHWQGTLPLAD